MDERRWQTINRLFEAAVELPEPRQADYLRQACGDDDTLRDAVLALLESDRQARTFLARPLSPSAETLPQTAEDTWQPGHRLGPYRLVRVLSQGGMGTVYLAERDDGHFQRQVAIKVVRGGLESPTVLQRFRVERQILADLEHPNIARLYEGGTTDDGRPYLVMEYVEGLPLDTYCHRRGLDAEGRTRLFMTVCEAVQFAHDRHLVHRDLKPANILVTADGAIKLLDFGIAKLLRGARWKEQVRTTGDGVRPMTLAYASPEQVQGDDITPASDVYALGVLLYRLLTGSSPYGSTTSPRQLEQAICDTDPLVASENIARDVENAAQRARHLAGDLDTILAMALRKQPERRYPSPTAFAEDLRRHLRNEPVHARRESVVYRLHQGWRRTRHGLVWALAASVIVFAAVGLPGLITSPGPLAQIDASSPRLALTLAEPANLTANDELDWLATAVTETLGAELSTTAGLAVFLPVAGVTPTGDLVLVGSYALFDDGDEYDGAPEARFDFELREVGHAEPLKRFSIDGGIDRVGEVAARAGVEIRRSLGLAAPSPEAVQQAHSGLPKDPESARLYARGLMHLRRLDLPAARQLLEQAAAQNPTSPAVAAALAKLWDELGYDQRAQEAAELALRQSTRLPRELRLLAEARVHETHYRWDAAESHYASLRTVFPSNPEHGLRQAVAATNAGRPEDALGVLQTLLSEVRSPELLALIGYEKARAEAARGQFDKALAQAKQTIEASQEIGSEQLEIRARLLEIEALDALGDYAAAHLASVETAARARQSGDRRSLAGTILARVGALTAPVPVDLPITFEEALAIYVDQGDREGEAQVLLLQVYEQLASPARWAEAESNLQAALEIGQETHNLRVEAGAWNLVGTLHYLRGQVEEAIEVFRRAVTTARRGGDIGRHIWGLQNLAVALHVAQEPEEASQNYRAAIDLGRHFGSRHDFSFMLANYGWLLIDLGRLEEAEATFSEALDIARAIDAAGLQAMSFRGRGSTRRQLGRADAGIADLEAAVDAFLKAEDIEGADRTRTDLSAWQRVEGRAAEAEPVLVEMASRHPLSAETLVALDVHQGLASNWAAQERYEEARGKLDELLRFDLQTYPDNRYQILRLDARVLAASGEVETATARLRDLAAQARAAGLERKELFARLDLGAILRRAGREAEGRAELRAVAAQAERLGFTVIAQRSHRELETAALGPVW